MVLSHNQMAYVAIVVTMIFGSLFVGVSGIMDTTVRYEDAGGDVLDDQDVSQLIQILTMMVYQIKLKGHSMEQILPYTIRIEMDYPMVGKY